MSASNNFDMQSVFAALQATMTPQQRAAFAAALAQPAPVPLPLPGAAPVFVNIPRDNSRLDADGKELELVTPAAGGNGVPFVSESLSNAATGFGSGGSRNTSPVHSIHSNSGSRGNSPTEQPAAMPAMINGRVVYRPKKRDDEPCKPANNTFSPEKKDGDDEDNWYSNQSVPAQTMPPMNNGTGFGAGFGFGSAPPSSGFNHFPPAPNNMPPVPPKETPSPNRKPSPRADDEFSGVHSVRSGAPSAFSGVASTIHSQRGAAADEKKEDAIAEIDRLMREAVNVQPPEITNRAQAQEICDNTKLKLLLKNGSIATNANKELGADEKAVATKLSNLKTRVQALKDELNRLPDEIRAARKKNEKIVAIRAAFNYLH